MGWTLTKLPKSLQKYGSSSSKVPSKVTPQTQDHVGTMRDQTTLLDVGYQKSSQNLEVLDRWPIRYTGQNLLYSVQPKSSQSPEVLYRRPIGYTGQYLLQS